MSDEPKISTDLSNELPVRLPDNGLRAGSLIGQSLSRLNQEQVQNLMLKAGEEALRLEVKNRVQNLDYTAGKKAIEDHVETFNMLDKRGKTTRQSVVSDVKTGAGNMRIESKSGATCFIASVAYRDPNHLDVMFLRKFRDERLIKSNFGKLFVKWYWINGPRIAKLINRWDFLKDCSKFLIGKIVFMLRKFN